ncbi:hypothetical protein I862_04245 [endosymbiont of Acanthamoeba sp. UWC8]|uniref:baseplate multidomain protein megatron n=1 Tax=endosymbiont of Acanthamoeba sp. UWC8 TaxID=86106 RepID=UPI0004D0D0DF|nr:glycoside hydrolase TIM-barrel-like domain-containing protein [endosymbiont of Acanthamoeba sp. UWC8]AIF81409.1 hypothetical protein I862_04245 [endosymbiont of Acanthamoeba sp. UWC8]
MASIVLATAAGSGATALGAGAFLSGVAGLAGAYLGGMVDRSLFGGGKNHNIHQEGSRMAELMVQVSVYGKVIPIVYGSGRIAGNIIWSLPIKEHVSTTTHTSGGGKGGGGGRVTTTTNSYSYSVSLAIAICEGVIDKITRAWADSMQLNLTEGSYTLYLGTEDQMPDSFMASFHPANQMPGYRGIAYVVIKDFPLARFGNRIPNFTFEVQRTVKLPGDLEDKIKEITLIPGAGEYVYDTVIQEKTTGAVDESGNFFQAGKSEKINRNNVSSKADVLVALDDLKTTLKNVEWVSVVINWFTDSKDPGLGVIKPGVEHEGRNTKITPDEWRVGNFSRSNAYKLLYFPHGTPTYGGTPTDKSIFRLCRELKSRGYKVLLYPMLQIDTITPECKPWRGRIIPNSVSDVLKFFERKNGYNGFILHYVNMKEDKEALKNYIDAFMIGSELVGLTQYMSESGVFPAVDCLKSLAGLVKKEVGEKVKLIYGADWSEYHSVNGWYNLDPLWSDENIDIIGIDCYFPLTPDLPQNQIDYKKVYDGWTQGEGWDYYYIDSVKRTGKTDYGNATYAWKNIKHWWSGKHINPDGSNTEWQPKMKPLWFTEIGFSSVDGCSNQPNVFYDSSSSESNFPRGSKGRIDFLAQRNALNASIDYLDSLSLEEPGLVAKKFVWTWDARPFPFWPDLHRVWADYNNWKTGHWVQGKLGLSNLGRIIAELLGKVGLDPTIYDTGRLNNIVEGYIITSRQTLRSILEQLAIAYPFDSVESEGILKFVKRGGIPCAAVDYSELAIKENDSEILTLTRTQELDLPRQVDIIYLNKTRGYQSAVQSSQRQTVKAVDSLNINLPLILSDQQAKNIADVLLYNAWVQRLHYQFTLPPKYITIEPTDIITLNKEGVIHSIRITSTKLTQSGMQEVTAVAEDITAYDFYIPAGVIPSNTELTAKVSPSRLELLDLPAFPTDNASEAVLRYCTVGMGSTWAGSAIYCSNDGGENYELIRRITTQATMGAVMNTIPSTQHYTWDNATCIDIMLIYGELQSVTEIAILNGANACVIGDEIIQFKNAILIGDFQYRLSGLLRGRLGTEGAMESHKIGERFILLNSTVAKELMPQSSFNMSKEYKPVTIEASLSDTEAQNFTYSAKALKPYSPVHIRGVRDESGNIIISWKRRTRIGGDWLDGVDIPLAEEVEAYEVDIMGEGKIKRTISGISKTQVIYPIDRQIADFGLVQDKITVKVYQLSASIGRGYAANATI